jgi:hypothetical protein
LNIRSTYPNVACNVVLENVLVIHLAYEHISGAVSVFDRFREFSPSALSIFRTTASILSPKQSGGETP